MNPLILGEGRLCKNKKSTNKRLMSFIRVVTVVSVSNLKKTHLFIYTRTSFTYDLRLRTRDSGLIDIRVVHTMFYYLIITP